MSSRQFRKQARHNGALAAGTKSPEGLQKSSQNALRHGLTAKSLVLGNESQTEFGELMEAFIQKFQPADTVELELVTEMVASRRRLRRVWLIQTAALDLQMDRMAPEIAQQFKIITHPTRLSLAFTTLANQEKSLQLLLRYETIYSRAFDRALKSLEKMQKSRIESNVSKELRNEPPPSPQTAPTEPKTPSPRHEIPNPPRNRASEPAGIAGMNQSGPVFSPITQPVLR